MIQWMFGRSLHRTNPASVAALLVGIALIPVSLGAAIVEHDRKLESRQRALQNEARAQAERLESLLLTCPLARPDHGTQPASVTSIPSLATRAGRSAPRARPSGTQTARSPTWSSCFREASGRRASSTAAAPRTRAP